MSTLNVSNITDGTTTVGTSYVVNGSAKAWISVNQTSTQAILNSTNVTSIIDQGFGLTTVNYLSAMSSATYSAISTGNAQNYSGSQGGVQSAGNAVSGGTKTAGRHTIDLRNISNNYRDTDDASSAVFGDLA
jgi:hypothetical protein